MSDMPGVKSAELWFAELEKRPATPKQTETEFAVEFKSIITSIQLDAFNAGRRQGADEEAARIKTNTEISGTPRPDVL